MAVLARILDHGAADRLTLSLAIDSSSVGAGGQLIVDPPYCTIVWSRWSDREEEVSRGEEDRTKIAPKTAANVA